MAYYANVTAAHRILLLGSDIGTNPGPSKDGVRVNVVNTRKHYLEQFAKAINPGSRNLNVAHINIRSLRNKLEEVKLLLHLCRFDVLSMTETHLDNTISDRQLGVNDYKIIRRDRGIGTTGGGCVEYVANYICSSRLRILETQEVEGIWLKLLIDSNVFVIGTIYRPPSDGKFFTRFWRGYG